MADILDPTGTGNDLLKQTSERLIPNIENRREPRPGDLGGQIADVEIPSENIPLPPDRTNLLQQQYIDQITQDPLTSLPYNVVRPAPPMPIVTEPSVDVNLGQQQPQQLMGGMQSGSLPSSLLPRGYVDQPFPFARSNYEGPDLSNIRSFIDERNRQRYQSTLPNGSEYPMIGVARSMSQGSPFTRAAEQSAQDFYVESSGIDVMTDSGLEEVRPPSVFDRVVAAPFTLVNGLLGAVDRNTEEGSIINRAGDFVQGVVNLSPLPDAEDVSYLRRIAGATLAEGVERFNQRREQVGNVRTGLDLLGRAIPSVGNANSAAAALQRARGNPARIFEPSPEEFVGFYGTPQDDPFFAGVAERSPELRNVIRSIQPQLDEAGRARVNPSAGYFGDFGNVGSLSALLYLTNIPQGTLQGALYDIADFYRTAPGIQDATANALSVLGGPVGNAVANYLTRFSPVPNENVNRIDTLGALYGRDYGFTQEYTEDRYLSFIGNPALDWIPQGYGIQTGAAFLGDMVLGGIADGGVDVIARRTARQLAREASETATRQVPELSATQFDVPQGIPLNFGESVRIPNQIPDAANVNEFFGYRPPQYSLSTEDQIIRDFMYLSDLENARQAAIPVGELPPASEPSRLPGFEPSLLTRETPSSEAARRTRADNVPVNFGEPTRLPEEDVLPDALSINEFFGYEPPQFSLSTSDQIVRDIFETADDEAARRAAREAAIPVGNLPSIRETYELYQPQVRGLLPEAVAPTVKPDLERIVVNDNVLTNGRSSIRPSRPDAPTPAAVPQEVVDLANRLRTVREEMFSVLPRLDVVNDRVRRGVSQANIERDNLQQTFNTLVQEERMLTRAVASNEAKNLVNAQTAPANPININPPTPEGETPPRTVNINSLKPTTPTPEAMLRSRLFPVSVESFGKVSRSDAAIEALGQMFGDIAPRRFTNEYMERLSNVARLRYLDLLDSNLYNKTGRAITDAVEFPEQIRIGRTRDGSTIDVVPELPPTPEPAIPSIPRSDNLSAEQISEVETELENTKKFFESARIKYNEAMAKGSASAQNHLARMEEAKQLVQQIYGDYPQVAARNAIDNLPVELAPKGAASQDTVEEYVATNAEFVREASTLKQSKSRLQEAQRIREQQAQALSEMPRLERIDPSTEITTRRVYNGEEDLSATHVKRKPPRDIALPRAVELPPAETNLTQRQLQQAVDNGEASPIMARYMRERPMSPVSDELAPNESELRQVFNTVDNMTYRELQIAVREIPGVKGNSSKEILQREVLNARLTEYENALVSRPSGGRFFFNRQGLAKGEPTTFYHGTKARNLDTAATSLTNEMGPGLYVTSSRDEAYFYSIAQPAEDLIDLDPDFRPEFTNVGRTFDIDVVDVQNVGKSSVANPRSFTVLDLSSSSAQEELRDLFAEVMQSFFRDDNLVRRFKSWSRNKHPNQYWHYVRSQLLKDGNSQTQYHRFTLTVQEELRLRNIDALRDGDSINIISMNYAVGEAAESFDSTGSIEEAIRARLAVDNSLANRVQNRTTEAIVAQNQLALDTYAVNNMKRVVADQERQALDAAKQLNDVESRLDEAVQADTQRNIQQQTDEGFRDAVNQHNRMEREGDICP